MRNEPGLRLSRDPTRPWWGSGPVVARAFHGALAGVFVLAFWSLGSQVEVLVGSRGLLPAHETLEVVAQRGFGFLDFPTLFLWLEPTDVRLVGGCALGGGLAAAALFGFFPRLCFAALLPLYLSYITLCRSFLHFQWDTLLIECVALAILLPRDRSRRWLHLLFSVVLFKVYWESGIAKLGSPIGDWQDGSAMSLYYETAPIPTALAWYAHTLPYGWHQLESWIVLCAELVVPFFAFGPRGLRRIAFVVLTFFLVVNAATANYGFFLPLTFCLHLFLLDDDDLRRVRARLPWYLGGGPAWRDAPPASTGAGRWGAWVLAAVVVPLHLSLSWGQFSLRFVEEPGSWLREEPAASLLNWNSRLLLVNTYHLFAQITPNRVEPEFQVRSEGEWVALPFHYKAGPVDRPPPFVAPHQPRVDFRLWFYGLSFENDTPGYVLALLERLCRDPEAVAPLFAVPPPLAPTAVRLVFWDYRFAKPEERSRGLWWDRSLLGESEDMPCGPPPPGSGAAP